MSIYKEINRLQKLIDPNSNKYSNIIQQMRYQTEMRIEFAFVNLPEDMAEEERENLLEWYKFFGNQDYTYTLSETSLVGKIV